MKAQDTKKTLTYRTPRSERPRRSPVERLALSVARAATEFILLVLALILLLAGSIWLIVTGADSFWWMFGGSVLLLLMFAGAGWCAARLVSLMK